MKKSKPRNIICINCSKRGHSFRECLYPVISYGIIGYKQCKDKSLEFVLIQRKDSIGFIDFIRGKYDSSSKKEEIFKTLIGEMTLREKYRLLTYTFDELWDQLWLNKNSRVYKHDYESAKKKYNSLDIDNMIRSSLPETRWDCSEYSIPKGRRNNSETPLNCAIREFSEETGILRKNIKLTNIQPVKEVFYGSDGISYSHIYYIAEIMDTHIPDIDSTNISQAGEIKYIGWFSFKKAMNIFRSYDSAKRSILNTVNNSLTTLLFKK